MKKTPHPMDVHVGSRIRMRRMMLDMSQEKLAIPLKITWQQLQKNEKGQNRIGASRLHQISRILQVPVSFFFEGATGAKDDLGVHKGALDPSYVTEFLATSDGLSLAKSFAAIKNQKLRRKIVELAEQIAGE